MTKILDVGHTYELLSLDGKLHQTLQFVKRFDKTNPSKFPGNKTSYPGTTMQSVIQCLCNRIRYLNYQIPCIENEIILANLQGCLLMLEQRAAKRHHIEFEPISLELLEFAKLCASCGHTICDC